MTPKDRENLSDYLESEGMNLVLETLLSEEDSPTPQAELQAEESSKESPLLSAPVPERTKARPAPDPNSDISITNSEELQRLNNRNFHTRGKYTEMLLGISSSLISFQHSILELEVRIFRPIMHYHHLYLSGTPETWLNLPELQQATGYKMWIYETYHCDILMEVVTGKFPSEEGK